MSYYNILYDIVIYSDDSPGGSLSRARATGVDACAARQARACGRIRSDAPTRPRAGRCPRALPSTRRSRLMSIFPRGERR